MQSFLNKVGKTASEAASKAGSKAGELVEIGKLKSKISSQKQNIGIAKKEIVAYCYELYKDGKIKDEKIEELCRKIEECSAEIEELEKKIEKVKDDYKAKTGEDFAKIEE